MITGQILPGILVIDNDRGAIAEYDDTLRKEVLLWITSNLEYAKELLQDNLQLIDVIIIHGCLDGQQEEVLEFLQIANFIFSGPIIVTRGDNGCNRIASGRYDYITDRYNAPGLALSLLHRND